MYRLPIASREQLQELKPELMGKVVRFEWGRYGIVVGLVYDVWTPKEGPLTVHFRGEDGRRDWLAIHLLPHYWAILVTTAEDRDPEEGYPPPALHIRDMR